MASALLAFSPAVLTASAAAFAASKSAVKSWIFASYAAILDGVLPSLLASTSLEASSANVAFYSAVAASTRADLASAKADFLAFTFAKAVATSSDVASGFPITVSASLTA